ncbi:MAG: outer membrane lipoprotein carrier protein LolA [Candidatus Aminicenantes bacterium]|nr:outer membrane lipoprotein carrier protein LolA [Candidatus Aminicenantes bacterium]
MNLKPALVILLLQGGWALQTALPVPEAAAEEVASRLEQRLRTLRSLRAEFEQTYRPASASAPLVEKGRLYFLRPDLMRWEYAEPEIKAFLYREGIFEQFYPEDNQLIRTRISPGDSGAEILSILTGAKNLGDDYAIELDDVREEKRAATRLKLTPRREGEYSLIFLDVNDRTSLLDRAAFVDFAGNRTEFQFNKARLNAPLPSGIFEIKVPEGCEVIDDLPPESR